MKVNVEIDCTPEEARRFLGLPDVTEVNKQYTDAMVKAMQGAGSFEQMQELGKQMAPMGQAGLKMFEEFMANAAASMVAGGSGAKPKGGKDS